MPDGREDDDAGADPPDEGGARSGDRSATRASRWLAGVLTAVGGYGQQVSSGSYTTVEGHAVLVLSCLLLGVVAGSGAGAIVRWARRRLEHRQPSRRVATIVLSVAVVAVSLAAFGLLGAPMIQHARAEAYGCSPATEFTVVTSSAVRATADELVAAFTEATAAGNGGCPLVHGYVYDAPEDTIVTAVSRQWQASGDYAPRRDVGPRPDIWLTESTLPLNQLRATAPSPDPVADDRSFGVSPLVLTSPGTERNPPLRTWPQAFAEDRDKPGGVVRPDPTRSTAALLASAALYGIDVDEAGGQTPDEPVVSPAVAENSLGATLSRGSFPDGDEAAILCRYQSLTGPLPELMLSEQAVNRFNARKPTGGACPPASLRLVPSGFRTPTLDHHVVRLSWAAAPGPPSAAGRFSSWLDSAAGRSAIRDTGLRATVAGDRTSADLVARGDLEPQAMRAVLRQYLDARRPRRDLLAIDVSGSMNEPNGRSSGSRRAAVVAAVGEALPAVRAGDQVGLWVFPADRSGRGYRPVVPLAADSGPAVTAALRAITPEGNTPLFQTIVDAVRFLGPEDTSAERRLVVVTDGEDTSSTVSRAALLDAVRGAEVKVSVITLGDVTCDADPLRELATTTGGECYDPGATGQQLTKALGG